MTQPFTLSRRRAGLALVVGALGGATSAIGASPAICDHPAVARFCAALPLPFTPAQAWASLPAETRDELGAALIGWNFAEFVGGDGYERNDRIGLPPLQSAASDAAHEILNWFPKRLEGLFPNLYGPDGDHAPWVYAAGLADLDQGPDMSDPIYALIEAHRAASEADAKARVVAQRAALTGDPAYRELAAERRRLCKVRHSKRRELRAGTPTTEEGFQALARYYGDLIPHPDPADVASQCAADYAAAAERARIAGEGGR